MTHMTTQARELTIAAYRAGEMDFRISTESANLAAEHATNPTGLIRAGKALVDAEFDMASEKNNLSDKDFEDFEELTDYYESYAMELTSDDDAAEAGEYTNAQVLTAVYLLLNWQAESKDVPYGGTETTHLLGSLAEHLKRELGGLGKHDPEDMADELAGTT